MLKIRSIYYLIPIHRTMDEQKRNIQIEKVKALNRIADTLERLLKISEMSR